MKAPRVTDHAVLRYLERVRGFDVESVRAHIAITCAAAASAGAASLRAESVKFVITGGAVVTITPDCGAWPSHTHLKRLIAGVVR